MPAINLITSQQFFRLIGLPGTPAIVNARMDVLSIAATIAIFVFYFAGALT
jgi:hypothetical protein